MPRGRLFETTEAAILTSSDGVSWSIPHLGTAYSFDDISFGRDVFIALARDGQSGLSKILTSSNGISWIERLSTSTDLRGVGAGTSLLVAVGAEGTILTSIDGIGWTQRFSGITNQLNAVAFGERGFVIAGASGSILTSPDGADWTIQDSGITNDLSSVAIGNGTIVVVGENLADWCARPFGIILTSTNGITWAAQSLDPLFASRSVVFGGDGIFVTMGESYIETVFVPGVGCSPVGYPEDPGLAAGTSEVFTSRDGLAWAKIGVAGEVDRIVFGNRTFATVGFNIFTSFDAKSWNPGVKGTTVNAGSSGKRAITFGNGVFVAVGDKIWTSHAGAWLEVVSPLIDGEIKLRVTGPVGEKCTLEFSSDLVHWIPKSTFTLPADSLVITDDRSSFERGFYRVASEN